MEAFKSALTELHGAEMDAMAASFWRPSSKATTVLLIQRGEAYGRSFLGWPQLLEAALVPLERLVTWRGLEDLEQRPLLQQVAFFRSADVLVGAVGAALGWMLLMAPGSQVLEWIPKGVQPCMYRCSEAWNVDQLGMFGGLGRLAAVDHVCLRAEKQPLRVSDARRYSATRVTARDAYWRRENLQVDLEKFGRWLREAVRRVAKRATRGAECVGCQSWSTQPLRDQHQGIRRRLVAVKLVQTLWKGIFSTRFFRIL